MPNTTSITTTPTTTFVSSGVSFLRPTDPTPNLTPPLSYSDADAILGSRKESKIARTLSDADLSRLQLEQAQDAAQAQNPLMVHG